MEKIGIIGAMEIEVSGLQARMEESQVFRLAGMDFYEGMLAGTRAVVVKSGVGKVNAAVCTQILADRFGVDCVINTGVAGSLDARIDIGDFVIATELAHHDVDATVFGYAPGEIPQTGTTFFPAEAQLIRATEEACRRACPETGVWSGRIVSGDQFIDNRARKDWIAQTFHALCVEMEGAAIAQTAYLNGLPFLVIRTISDKADESAQSDNPAFEKEAAERSIELVWECLKVLVEKRSAL